MVRGPNGEKRPGSPRHRPFPPLRNSSSRSILSLTTVVLLSRAFFFAR